MASQKYLTKDGLEKIASYVNEKSKIVSLTKAQYDALTETQKKDEHIIYNITDMDAPGTVPIKYYENADDYYNLTDAQKEAIEELVIVNDDEGEPLSADNVSCQDAEGVLTNVQSVVDEITDDITSLNDTIVKTVTLENVATMTNVSAGSSGSFVYLTLPSGVSSSRVINIMPYVTYGGYSECVHISVAKYGDSWGIRPHSLIAIPSTSTVYINVKISYV